jgi:hypothetical protein
LLRTTRQPRHLPFTAVQFGELWLSEVAGALHAVFGIGSSSLGGAALGDVEGRGGFIPLAAKIGIGFIGCLLVGASIAWSAAQR